MVSTALQFCPRMYRMSMGIALYALFIGLLLPSVRKNRPADSCSLRHDSSALIKWTPFFAGMNRGIAIMTATGLAALIGAIIFPLEKKETH